MALPFIIAWSIFFFAIGACVGSFLNVVIWRLPYRGREVIFLQKTGKLTLSWPPSHCPICDSPIRWYQNIPMFSWIFLRAHCAHCKTAIPVRYPLVELGTAVLFTAFFLAYFVGHWPTPNADPSEWIWTNSLANGWPFALHLALVGALLAASAIDVDLYIIPLSIPYVILILGIVAAIFIDHPAIPTLREGSWLIRWVAGGTVGLLLANLLLFTGILPRSFASDMVEPPKAEGEAKAAELHHKEADVPVEPAGTAPIPFLSEEGPLAPPPKLTRFKAPLITAGVLLALNVVGWFFLSAQYASLASVITGIVIVFLGVFPRDTGQLDVTQEVIEEISNPRARREILKEALFVAIPIVCAAIAHFARIPMPSQPWLLRVLGCCLGILVGGGLIWIVRIGGTLWLNKEAMGMGDAHLMAGVGAVLGCPLVIIAFVPLGVFAALFWIVLLLVMRKPHVLQFGPWLSVGAILGLLIGNAVIAWYLSILFPAP